jgi:hypothetical protein
MAGEQVVKKRKYVKSGLYKKIKDVRQILGAGVADDFGAQTPPTLLDLHVYWEREQELEVLTGKPCGSAPRGERASRSRSLHARAAAMNRTDEDVRRALLAPRVLHYDRLLPFRFSNPPQPYGHVLQQSLKRFLQGMGPHAELRMRRRLAERFPAAPAPTKPLPPAAAPLPPPPPPPSQPQPQQTTSADHPKFEPPADAV